MARRTLSIAAVAIAAVATLSGCSLAGYDEVLVRQVLAFKDPMMRGLVESVGIPRAEFVDDLRSEGGRIPGPYWDGSSDAGALGLERGGAVVSGVHSSKSEVAFDVFIASGPRDAAGDRFVDAGSPYFGPPAVYICFTVVVDVVDDRVATWRRMNHGPRSDGEPCEGALAAAAGAGASAEPVHDFDG